MPGLAALDIGSGTIALSNPVTWRSHFIQTDCSASSCRLEVHRSSYPLTAKTAKRRRQVPGTEGRGRSGWGRLSH